MFIKYHIYSNRHIIGTLVLGSGKATVYDSINDKRIVFDNREDALRYIGECMAACHTLEVINPNLLCDLLLAYR